MSNFSILLLDPVYLIAFIIVLITIVTFILVFMYKYFTNQKTPNTSICILHLLFTSILYSIISIINFNINRMNEHSTSPKEAFNEPLCSIQAFILIWLSYSRELWSFIIIFSCIKFITEQRYITKSIKHFHIYTIPLCYIFPLIISLLFLFNDNYGINYLNCGLYIEPSYIRIIASCIKCIITFLIIFFGIKVVNHLIQKKKIKTQKVSYKIQFEYITNQMKYSLCIVVDSIISIFSMLYVTISKDDNVAKRIGILNLYVSISLGLVFTFMYLILLCNNKKCKSGNINKEVNGFISEFTEDDINEQSIMNIVNDNERQTKVQLTESYYD